MLGLFRDNNAPETAVTEASQGAIHKFIYVLEGKIARIDSSNLRKEIAGLCTHEFSSCNILVLISKDNSRCVMIHADQSLEESKIREQIVWVGADSKKFLYRRGSYSGQQPHEITAKILPNLESEFTAIIVDETTECIAIEVNSGKLIQRESLVENVDYHPLSAQLILQHRVETNFSDEKILDPLMFDCSDFTEYKDLSISDKSKLLFTVHQINASSSPGCILAFIKENFVTGWPINSAANVYSYLWLMNNAETNLETFIADSNKLFLADIERFCHGKLSPEWEPVTTFLNSLKECNSADALHEKTMIFLDENPNIFINETISAHCDVLNNAYKIFETYADQNKDNLIQSVCDSRVPFSP